MVRDKHNKSSRIGTETPGISARDWTTGAAAYDKNGVLCIEEIPIRQVAEQFGTPLYVYSAAVLRKQYHSLEKNLTAVTPNVTICYALKANANPAVGSILAGMGAGADVVSGGELYLAHRMGFPGDKTVFAGVGKTRREMAEALHARVRSFHVESRSELEVLAQVAAENGTVAPVAVRVNPDVEAETHPYISTGTSGSKFGVPLQEGCALMMLAASLPSLKPVGLHAHIGSQLQRVQPILDTTKLLLKLWDVLADNGIILTELDIGGGLGIQYRPDDTPEGPEALAAGLRPLIAGRKLELLLEPGRFLVGPAGVLLTTVTYLKEPTATKDHTTLAIVDAGMNDLLRPALYGAWHPVWPEYIRPTDAQAPVDVVGPVCESSDVLARQRLLGPLKIGDVLTIGQAGAYGYSMSSQYNGRPRAAEVLVSGHEARLVRRRESYNDLWAQTTEEE